MVSAETKSVIDRAKQIYATQLQRDLESQHRDWFVAIEPESGEFFLGDTFDEAVKFHGRRKRTMRTTNRGEVCRNTAPKGPSTPYSFSSKPSLTRTASST